MKRTVLVCFFISLCIIIISCSNNATDGTIDGLTDYSVEPVNNSKDDSSDRITITLGGLYTTPCSDISVRTKLT